MKHSCPVSFSFDSRSRLIFSRLMFFSVSNRLEMKLKEAIFGVKYDCNTTKSKYTFGFSGHSRIIDSNTGIRHAWQRHRARRDPTWNDICFDKSKRFISWDYYNGQRGFKTAGPDRRYRYVKSILFSIHDRWFPHTRFGTSCFA